MTSSLDLMFLAVAIGTTVVAPVAAFGVTAALDVIGRPVPDHRLALVARIVFVLTTLAGLSAAGLYLVHGAEPVRLMLGHWFSLGDPDASHYGFDVGFLVDSVSLTYLVLTSVLCGVVGAFSLRYLAGEPGSGRFFALLMLFSAALSLLVVSESLDLAFIGWELVGITSALLIAFYRERASPVEQGLIAFMVYRVCDASFLIVLVVLHHVTGTGSLPADGTVVGAAALPLGLLLLFASLGKSAQWPLGGWLPRAMEGPTPSSAIFYGALSVHAGAYLLLRTAAIWETSVATRVAIVSVGVLSTLFATLSGRAQTDVKSAQAFAAITQVGLIYVEIGLGLHTLALVHVVGHAFVRTLQLLRAPSIIDDYFAIRRALGDEMRPTGAHYEKALPGSVRRWLYHLALQRGYLDAIAQRALVFLWHFVRAFDRFDRALASTLDGEANLRDLLPEQRVPDRDEARAEPSVTSSSEVAR